MHSIQSIIIRCQFFILAKNSVLYTYRFHGGSRNNDTSVNDANKIVSFLLIFKSEIILKMDSVAIEPAPLYYCSSTQ